MNEPIIAIATITWARNEEEESVLRAALPYLSDLDLPVFITDGGSSQAFLAFLKSFPNFHVHPAAIRGVWPQAKNSLAMAYENNAPFIFYTEPDKKDFFQHHLPDFFKEKAVDDRTGVITASRSAQGFATFPPFQQMTETTINNCCAELIGKELDYTYGPFLLRRELVPHTKKIREDIGWGWRPFVFHTAHRLGYNVDAYVGDFSCPMEQQNDDAKERTYRMKQLQQNIQGLLLAEHTVL